jgi:hypothetical protein
MSPGGPSPDVSLAEAMDARPSRPRTPNPLLEADGVCLPPPAPASAAADPFAAPRMRSGHPSPAPPGLTDADIASFKALDAEVHFEHPEWGEFWLVPEYTDQDRLEITPEHISRVSAALRTFGAKVVRFGRMENAPETIDVSLASARAHLRQVARHQIS